MERYLFWSMSWGGIIGPFVIPGIVITVALWIFNHLTISFQ